MYPQDFHPGSTVQYSVAEEIAERIQGYHFPTTLDPDKICHRQVITHGGSRPHHIWPNNCDIDDYKPGEFFTADQICYNEEPITPDKDSEILVVGNSSIQFPMAQPDALQAFLAERLLYRVDNLRVNASGPFTTVIQRFFDNPAFYLKGKKLIVLQTLDTILTEDRIPWNNIKIMDRQRMMLNGKKLIASFSIDENGKWSDDISNKDVREIWNSFGEKKEIKCFDDKLLEIANKQINGVDLSKPLFCIVQTLRSALYDTPKCFVNDQEKDIPADYHVSVLSWQNIYFDLPEGTDTIRISVQGKQGTIIGFNQVFIYQ